MHLMGLHTVSFLLKLLHEHQPENILTVELKHQDVLVSFFDYLEFGPQNNIVFF